MVPTKTVCSSKPKKYLLQENLLIPYLGFHSGNILEFLKYFYPSSVHQGLASLFFFFFFRPCLSFVVLVMSIKSL